MLRINRKEIEFFFLVGADSKSFRYRWILFIYIELLNRFRL